MLNELLEYEQYTYVFKSDLNQNYKRLKHGTLTNQLSGIERAMKIIAAHYFYEDDNKSREERIKTAKEALEFWCGIPTKETLVDEKQFENINLWLPKYINGVLIKTKISDICALISKDDSIKGNEELCENLKDCFDEKKVVVGNAEKFSEAFKSMATLLANKGYNDKKIKILKQQIGNLVKTARKIENKKTQFGQRLYSDYDSKENDANKLTYDRIIANAIRHGPLKRYYLVCELKNEAELENKVYVKGKGKAQLDVPLKLTAMYLLATPKERRKTGAQYVPRFAAIKQCDLANWQTLDGKIQKDKIEKYYYISSSEDAKQTADKRLFEQLEQRIGGNYTKIRINEKWMKDFQWDIVEENELDAYLSEKKGRSFFRDDGAGKPLVWNERYEK